MTKRSSLPALSHILSDNLRNMNEELIATCGINWRPRQDIRTTTR